jgi:hypothetical protein
VGYLIMDIEKTAAGRMIRQLGEMPETIKTRALY